MVRVVIFVELILAPLHYLPILATTALRASAARSGSRGIRHFKIRFWNPKVLEIVLEDRCWGGGVRVYQEIILLLSSKHMQIFNPFTSAPPPLSACTFSKIYSYFFGLFYPKTPLQLYSIYNYNIEAGEKTKNPDFRKTGFPGSGSGLGGSGPGLGGSGPSGVNPEVPRGP